MPDTFVDPTHVDPSDEAPDDGATPETEGATEGDERNDAKLGPQGEKALNAFKERARQAERELKEKQAELDALRKESMTEQERAVAEAAEAARNTAMAEINGRLFAAEVRAQTAGKVADPALFSDPDVAQRLLGFDEIPLVSGEIDTDAIEGAIASMLEKRPYLAAQPKPPSFDGGPRGSGTADGDMNSILRRAAGRT